LLHSVNSVRLWSCYLLTPFMQSVMSIWMETDRVGDAVGREVTWRRTDQVGTRIDWIAISERNSRTDFVSASRRKIPAWRT
jgi:hypothetical protein